MNVFIREHREDDVQSLMLTSAQYDGVDLREAAIQIEAWQTARHKLPTFAAIDSLIYPPRINMEQCSSEATAKYKAGICHRLCKSEDTLIDLTGGFGVDFVFMAAEFEHSIYVEQNAQLCRLATHNFPLLLKKRYSIVNVCEYNHPAEMLYIDPARRDTAGRKVSLLKDCTPDIITLLPTLTYKHVMLKLSPMLDITATVRDLAAIGVLTKEIHVVAVDNECKELLVICTPPIHHSHCEQGETTTYAVDLKRGIRLSWAEIPDDVRYADNDCLQKANYLYEPNAAILKAGGWNVLTHNFEISKLSPHSHLYVSEQFVADFPGRKFRIEAISGMSKSELRRLLSGISAANITVRGFPITVEAMRRKLNLREGGNIYIFAATNNSGKHILLRCQQ